MLEPLAIITGLSSLLTGVTAGVLAEIWRKKIRPKLSLKTSDPRELSLIVAHNFNAEYESNLVATVNIANTSGLSEESQARDLSWLNKATPVIQAAWFIVEVAKLAVVISSQQALERSSLLDHLRDEIKKPTSISDLQRERMIQEVVSKIETI